MQAVGMELGGAAIADKEGDVAACGGEACAEVAADGAGSDDESSHLAIVNG